MVNPNFGILKVIYSTMVWTVIDLDHFTVSSMTDKKTSHRKAVHSEINRGQAESTC